MVQKIRNIRNSFCLFLCSLLTFFVGYVSADLVRPFENAAQQLMGKSYQIDSPILKQYRDIIFRHCNSVANKATVSIQEDFLETKRLVKLVLCNDQLNNDSEDIIGLIDQAIPYLKGTFHDTNVIKREIKKEVSLQHAFLFKVSVRMAEQAVAAVMQILDEVDQLYQYWMYQQHNSWHYFLHKSPQKWFCGKKQTIEVQDNIRALVQMRKKYFTLLGRIVEFLCMIDETKLTEQEILEENSLLWINNLIRIIEEGLFESSIYKTSDPTPLDIAGRIRFILANVARHAGNIITTMHYSELRAQNHLERNWLWYSSFFLSAYLMHRSYNSPNGVVRWGIDATNDVIKSRERYINSYFKEKINLFCEAIGVRKLFKTDGSSKSFTLKTSEELQKELQEKLMPIVDNIVADYQQNKEIKVAQFKADIEKAIDAAVASMKDPNISAERIAFLKDKMNDWVTTIPDTIAKPNFDGMVVPEVNYGWRDSLKVWKGRDNKALQHRLAQLNGTIDSKVEDQIGKIVDQSLNPALKDLKRSLSNDEAARLIYGLEVSAAENAARVVPEAFARHSANLVGEAVEYSSRDVLLKMLIPTIAVLYKNAEGAALGELTEFKKQHQLQLALVGLIPMTIALGLTGYGVHAGYRWMTTYDYTPIRVLLCDIEDILLRSKIYNNSEELYGELLHKLHRLRNLVKHLVPRENNTQAQFMRQLYQLESVLLSVDDKRAVINIIRERYSFLNAKQ